MKASKLWGGASERVEDRAAAVSASGAAGAAEEDDARGRFERGASAGSSCVGRTGVSTSHPLARDAAPGVSGGAAGGRFAAAGTSCAYAAIAAA